MSILSKGFAVIESAFSRPGVRPDGKQGLLPVGSEAPDLVGTDADGHLVRLSERRRPSVVYFYPKDDTPGCTREACAFRDAWADFAKATIDVFGVSGDDDDSHAAFRSKYRLPFFLVADRDGKIRSQFGVGSLFGMSARVTFLLDKDRRIAHAWPQVDPTMHAADVLEKAMRLG